MEQNNKTFDFNAFMKDLNKGIDDLLNRILDIYEKMFDFIIDLFKENKPTSDFLETIHCFFDHTIESSKRMFNRFFKEKDF